MMEDGPKFLTIHIWMLLPRLPEYSPLSFFCRTPKSRQRGPTVEAHSTHAGTWLRQQCSWQIPDFAVSYVEKGDSSAIAGQSMFHGETAATCALLGHSRSGLRQMSYLTVVLRGYNSGAPLQARQNQLDTPLSAVNSTLSMNVSRELFRQDFGGLCCSLSLLLPDCWPFLQCFWVELLRMLRIAHLWEAEHSQVTFT